MLRTPEALVPYVFALACFAAGGLWHAADVSRGQPVTVGTATVGGPFRLIDQNGETRTDADFRGRWMWVYFGYSNCPDVCPTTLVLMDEVLKQLGGSANRVVPIFISLDPAHDTPKILKLYLASFNRRFIGLTGSEQQIASVAKEYRVYRVKRPVPGGGYSIDHSSVICLMAPDGKFAAVYDTSDKPENIATDIKKRL